MERPQPRKSKGSFGGSPWHRGRWGLFCTWLVWFCSKQSFEKTLGSFVSWRFPKEHLRACSLSCKGSPCGNRLAWVKSLARRASQQPCACTTDLGRNLEALLERCRIVEEAKEESVWAPLMQGSSSDTITSPLLQEEAIPGLSQWLDRLELSRYSTVVTYWAEQNGACYLDELVENSDELGGELGLSPLEMERLRDGGREAADATRDAPRSVVRDPQADAQSFGSESVLSTFDRKLEQACSRRQQEEAECTDSLEGDFAVEVRLRQWTDLLYLKALRLYVDDQLPWTPSLARDRWNDEARTWALSSPSELKMANEDLAQWLELAGDRTSVINLPALRQEERRAIRRILLHHHGASAILLDAYFGSFRSPPTVARCAELVTAFKALALETLLKSAGAGSLLAGRPSFFDAFLESGKGGAVSEAFAAQVSFLGKAMENTRITHSDAYFRNALFGLCLGRIAQRFQLVRGADTLPPLSEEVMSRLNLEESLGRHGQNSDDNIAIEQFERFANDFLQPSEADPKATNALERLLDLSPTVLAALRRRTDFMFGSGLREEIFKVMEQAQSENADVSDPVVCTKLIVQGGSSGVVRMLSASPELADRLTWDAVLFGAFLQRTED